MTEKELQQLIEEISLQFFHKPFRHRAFFNPRLRTTGGRYMLKSHNIEINRKYLDEKGLDELIGILKHELCHYHLHLEGRGYRHGDRDFKELLKQTDSPRYCSSLESSKKAVRPAKWLYQCTACQAEFQRKRRMDIHKYVCGRCRGRIILIK